MKYSILFSFIFLLNVSANDITADVINVSSQENNGKYTFSVTLNSIETGCAQYADWWEILAEDGTLLHRRILVHSHPATQPFTRSGRAIKIGRSDKVYVRGHMNKEGYSGSVMEGSVEKGF